MTIRIESRTDKPLWLRLNSGQSLHLAPYQTSGEIRDIEIRSNAKIQKLREQHIITIYEGEAKRKNPGQVTGKTGSGKSE